MAYARYSRRTPIYLRLWSAPPMLPLCFLCSRPPLLQAIEVRRRSLNETMKGPL